MAPKWRPKRSKNVSKNEVEKKCEKERQFLAFGGWLAECAALHGRKKEGCDIRLRRRILKIDKKKKTIEEFEELEE